MVLALNPAKKVGNYYTDADSYRSAEKINKNF
jgi:hypothetical protein